MKCIECLVDICFDQQGVICLQYASTDNKESHTWLLLRLGVALICKRLQLRICVIHVFNSLLSDL